MKQRRPDQQAQSRILFVVLFGVNFWIGKMVRGNGVRHQVSKENGRHHMSIRIATKHRLSRPNTNQMQDHRQRNQQQHPAQAVEVRFRLFE